MNNQSTHITEVYYHPIEITIEKAASEVKIEHALPLLYDKVEGVTVLHPGGAHGKGTLELAVAGEEIFPEGFHARTFMMMHSSHKEDEMINKDIDGYLYEFEERAKGSTVMAKYNEPSTGEGGILYMIFKLTRQKSCE